MYLFYHTFYRSKHVVIYIYIKKKLIYYIHFYVIICFKKFYMDNLMNVLQF